MPRACARPLALRALLRFFESSRVALLHTRWRMGHGIGRQFILERLATVGSSDVEIGRATPSTGSQAEPDLFSPVDSLDSRVWRAFSRTMSGTHGGEGGRERGERSAQVVIAARRTG